MADKKEEKKAQAKETKKEEKKEEPKQVPSQSDKPSKEQELQKKIDELTEILKRVQADYENYRKRVERDMHQFVQCSNKDLIAKFLPLLDSFELALKNKDRKDDFIKGMELIYSSLFSALEKEGLRPIASEGKKFDPYCHEALLSERSEKEEGMVIEELQKGYMLKDKVLRTAKVKISKK